MRIRKRAVPFPLSSLLPVPISDPLINLNRPAPVPAVVQSATTDRPIGHGTPTNGCDFISKLEDHCSEVNVIQKDEEEKNIDIIRDTNQSAQTALLSGSSLLNSSPPSSISPQVLVPPKKRRGNNNSSSNTNDKSKGIDKKSAGRGGALMEGSRCSRVNGRGWRCCQQTLVGYSLCEHHLGKGRLRSMNSVRSRPTAKPAIIADTNTSTPTYLTDTQHPQPPQLKEELDHDRDLDRDRDGGHDYEDEMKSSSNKKRAKLGMVKARSISSLLGQTSSNNNNTDGVGGATSLTHTTDLI